MRALFLLITVLCASAYSINPFTYPWIIRLTGDTATVAKWKGNNDTVQVWAGRMSDTTNKISREIDSIRAGTVAHDSIAVTGGFSTVRAYISGLLQGATALFTGTVTVDSLKSTKGINATTGTFSGRVGADSLRSTKGVSGTIGRFTTSIISAIGTFTGTVTVDSLKSTKGINATTGTFSGRVNGATIGDDVVDYSTTSTIVGFSSTTTASIRYAKQGKKITVFFDIQGTSNSTNFNFTVLGNNAFTTRAVVHAYNGTNETPAYINISAGGTTVNVYLFAATWPSSGTKTARGQFSYYIN